MEKCSSQSIKDILKFDLVVNGSMKSDNTNILFTSSLLRFGEASGSIEADDKAACNFGIKGSRMPGFFDIENFLDPGDDLM